MSRAKNHSILPYYARATHLHVIGQPGTGKSRALESWFMQDVAAGHGAGVLDPHGELFDHLVARLARLCESNPTLAERVVIINPTDPTWTVGFNPLEKIEGLPTERQAAYLSDVVIKVTKLESTGRTYRLLNFTFLALAELGLTLASLPRFLTDGAWREELLARPLNPDLARYFQHEFPRTRGGAHEWVTPILNRIGALLFDPDLRLLFSTGSTLHFREILDRGLILLVNLSKGQLGEANSALLGAFVVAHIQKAALARSKGSERWPFFLYLDEFQNYTTDNIKDILSESRKYALSLVMAHQYLDQLAPDLLGAVLNTTGTLACFRVGYRDATVLAHELFLPAFRAKSDWSLEFRKLGSFALPVPVQEEVLLRREDQVTLLTQLEHREFWSKRRGAYLPSKQRTLDMHVLNDSEALTNSINELCRVSGERYGRLKAEVRSQLEKEDTAPAVRNAALPVIDYEEI